LLYVADELTREALYKSGGAEMLNASAKQGHTIQGAECAIVTHDGGQCIWLRTVRTLIPLVQCKGQNGSRVFYR
jgi:hypothetical protein